MWLDRASSTLNGRNKAAQNNIAPLETVKCHNKKDNFEVKTTSQLELSIVSKHLSCSTITIMFKSHYDFILIFIAISIFITNSS